MLSVFLAFMILLNLIGWLPSITVAELSTVSKYAYAEVATNDEDFFSIKSFNINVGEMVKKNTSPIENKKLEPESNINNNVISNDQNKNETKFAFKITDRMGNFTSSNNAGILGSDAAGDFNGDGFEDKAIGVPNEDVFSRDTGAVYVIYGFKNGLNLNNTSGLLPQIWTQNDTSDVNERDDMFGFSLSSGDYNGDGHDDLAIGTQSEDIDSIRDAGIVQVIYGSPDGLSNTAVLEAQLWTQDLLGGEVEPDDGFGAALSSGDYNNDTKDDLAIGGHEDDASGIVHVIYGSPDGLATNVILEDQQWTQDQLGETPEPEDFFGSVLSSGDYNGDGHDDLALAAPAEDSIADLYINHGLVHVIYGSPVGLSTNVVLANQQWYSNFVESEDLFGMSLSSGDYNGDEHDDLAIGVPWEGDPDFDNQNSEIPEKGVVRVIYGSPLGLDNFGVLETQTWRQDELAIDTNVLDFYGAQFGFSLASGDYDGDGYDDLAINAPFFGEFHPLDIGIVHVIFGSSIGLHLFAGGHQDQVIQRQDYIDDPIEPVTMFGISLGSGDYNGDDHDDLAIGIPWEDLSSITDAGMLLVLYGTPNGFWDTILEPQVLTEELLGETIDNYDYFGFTL